MYMCVFVCMHGDVCMYVCGTDYLAVFASVVPELIELEEPLCVLLQRVSATEEPQYSPIKHSKPYRASGDRSAGMVH